MAQITLNDLSKSWGDVTAVDGISLSVDDGEFIAILGPSGCGKSTTLFMLAGVYLPTRGDILFDGSRVNDVEARLRNVGIVFQSYALYPNMNVLQNILFPTRFQKLDNAEVKARDMAALVQVEELLHRRPSELSGGQQQRVALARALIKEPNLLLLDEPLSNLDATLRLTMRAEIRRITRELGVTTVLVTHDQLEATMMADRIVCMNAGRIEQVGDSQELYSRPSTTFVASFIGSPPINMLDAGSAGLVVPEGTARVGIRPESLRPASAGISGTVSHIEHMGRESLVTCNTAFGPLRFIETTSQSTTAIDDTLMLAFAEGSGICFDRNGTLLAGTAQLEHIDA